MILFADFDGTFYMRDDEKQTRDNIEAVRAWRAAGNQFCITTGRSYRSVSEQLPQVKVFCDYYIVDSGSIILSESGEVINTFCFGPDIIANIIKFSESLPEATIPFYYTVGYEGTAYKNKGVTKLRLWFKNLDSMVKVAKRVRNSFPVYAFEQEAISNYKELVGWKGFVEIIPDGYGKSNAIKTLQIERGIPSKDIVTIGDGLNDYEMVRDFDGFAIAGSVLAGTYGELKTVNSVLSLIERLS